MLITHFFHQKYAGLAITGEVRCTSKERLCQEIALDFLQLRQCYRKFYKFCKNESPRHLSNLTTLRHSLENTRNV